MRQYWTYSIYHRPTDSYRTGKTLCEMTPHQFLSALAWWNIGLNYVYTPDWNQIGILSQQECRNVSDKDDKDVWAR